MGHYIKQPPFLITPDQLGQFGSYEDIPDRARSFWQRDAVLRVICFVNVNITAVYILRKQRPEFAHTAARKS